MVRDVTLKQRNNLDKKPPLKEITLNKKDREVFKEEKCCRQIPSYLSITASRPSRKALVQ